MLIQDFVQVDCPCSQVCSAIEADPRALLAAIADAAYREGEQLCLTLTPSLSHKSVGKQVQVDVSHAYRLGDRLILPIQWWATGAPALFPRLEGDIEVAPLGPERTEITLMGRYDPPLAVLGRQLDRLLLHRVAEACVRSFLTRLGASVGCAVKPMLATGRAND